MKIVEEITEHYRRLEPRRFVLGLLALPFLAIGWIGGLIVRAVWFVGAWAWAALIVGFRKGKGAR